MFLKKNNFFQFISFLMLLFFIGDNSLAASEKRRRSVSPAGAASSVVVAGSVGDAEDSGEEEADVEEEAPIAGRHFYSRDYNLKLGAINLQEPLKRWHDEALAVVSRLSDECTSPNYAKASIL